MFDNTPNTAVSLTLLAVVLLALWLIYIAIKDTLSWYHFGKISLYTDPKVGAVGGQVGGRIYLNRLYKEETRFKVILKNLYYYTSNYEDTDGKTCTQTVNKLVYEAESYAKVLRIDNKSALEFCFDIDDKQRPTESFGTKGYSWEVEFILEEYKYDFSRSFIIPVKKGKQNAQFLSVKASNQHTIEESNKLAMASIPIFQRNGVIYIEYPPFYNWLVTKTFGAVGLGVTGIGVAILMFENSVIGWFVGGAFTFFGGMLLARTLYDNIPFRQVTIEKYKLSERASIFNTLLYERSIDLKKKFKFKRLSMFGEELADEGHSSFVHIVIEQDDTRLYLVRHIASITEQDHLMKLFKEQFKKPEKPKKSKKAKYQ